MFKKNLIYDKKLFFHLYLIGYKNKGESIIILLENDCEVIYAGLIDTYKSEKNKVFDILKDKNVEKLNMFCWTHPHSDHSGGIIDILKNFTTSKTSIVVPKDIYLANELSNKKIKWSTEEIKEAMNIIKSYINTKKKNVPFVKDVSDQSIIYNDYIFGSTKYLFSIQSISPKNEPVTKQIFFNKNDTRVLNKFSISLKINIGKAMFFLGGDIENDMIKKITNSSDGVCPIPEKIDYIKIPHHGSKYSNNILKNIKYKGSIAVGTKFIQGKVYLPDEICLNNYINKFNEVIFTKNESFNYHVLHTKYDVILNKFYNQQIKE